ncbi:Fpg/Nei family DNA glycosylase [Neolewinella antarctica]|uniref:Formamidopyrimidine-DNA glycosylase n=1 Tax=Neolewinella antarctica TaxID=442734 RepID=A0ABX0X6B0_9BACT|nr:DNA-formamidopyrimidine glycosylase family protein [Neolewinella antarctica]NJC24750.1 formamidopyrimidine-DNA glycosylase [Neolewinella antarctica]
MPELPEVHNFKKYFDAAATGQKIAELVVHDDKIIRNMPGPAFADACRGRTIIDSLRRGKYLFANLDNGEAILLHFGMTGDLNLYQQPEDKGRFERFAFHFTDGNVLGFEDPRKFARVLYLKDRDAYIAEVKLGPDALDLRQDYFFEKLAGRKTTLKGILLNQSVVAGLGNLYVDEICYRCNIHPAARVNEMSDDAKKAVYDQIMAVMRYATENAPYYHDYPENWFWHTWRKEGQPDPVTGGEVKIVKVAGRTTYYVEGKQTLPSATD